MENKIKEVAIKGEVKPSLYVVTGKYGVIESKMTPGFTENSGAIEKKYKIENIPEEVMDICRELRGLGGTALLVGGCVRDAVISQEREGMNVKPKDFDLEIYGLSLNELQRVLETKFGSKNVDAVGKAFGVIKVRINGWEEPLDFSSPRIDSKLREGHKGIDVKSRPDMTVKEAAARRDITINSMAYDPLTETIYDAYGGIQDIKDGLIRMTDMNVFVEDPLRVIRVMQFAARFGFKVEKITEEVCSGLVRQGFVDMRRNAPTTMTAFFNEPWDPNKMNQKENIDKGEGDLLKGFLVVEGGATLHRKPIEKKEHKGLPPERVAEELYKLLLKGKTPSHGFEFAQRIGLIKKYWPELDALKGVEQEDLWHPEGDVWNHSMQVVDAMAEIADRELALGNIPTADMWTDMEDEIEKFVLEKKKEHRHQMNMAEIASVMGEAALLNIVQAASELGEEVSRAYIEKMEGIAKETAISHARKVFWMERGVWNGERREFTYNEGWLQMSEEEKEIRVNEMAQIEIKKVKTRNKQKWTAEAQAQASGTEQKALRKMINETVARMINDGGMTEERVMKMDKEAEQRVNGLSAEERKKRSTTLKNTVKIVLVLSALGHDLGKATTTKFEDGRIRSKGHEQAGVAPMRRIFETLYETRFSSSIKRQVLPLIGEHLKPPEIWRDITGLTERESEEENIEKGKGNSMEGIGSGYERTETELRKATELKRRLTRLAGRLAVGDSGRSLKGGTKQPFYPDGGGTNLYMLGLLTEADRRGRRKGNRPYTLEEINEKNKLVWQGWWNDRINELNLDKPAETTLKGGDLMEALHIGEKQGGPWVRVILNCVEADLRDGMISPKKEDALQAGLDYYRRLHTYVEARWEMLADEKRTEREKINLWKVLGKIDARELISPSSQESVGLEQ